MNQENSSTQDSQDEVLADVLMTMEHNRELKYPAEGERKADQVLLQKKTFDALEGIGVVRRARATSAVVVNGDDVVLDAIVSIGKPDSAVLAAQLGDLDVFTADASNEPLVKALQETVEARDALTLQNTVLGDENAALIRGNQSLAETNAELAASHTALTEQHAAVSDENARLKQQLAALQATASGQSAGAASGDGQGTASEAGSAVAGQSTTTTQTKPATTKSAKKTASDAASA